MTRAVLSSQAKPLEGDSLAIMVPIALGVGWGGKGAKGVRS